MRRARGTWSVLFVCVVFSSALHLWADGLRNPPPGAVGLGRAGVVIAESSDASAVFYNPANLALIQGNSIEAAVSIAHSTLEYSRPGYNLSSDTDWQVLPNLFVATPIQYGGKTFSLGLGLTTPFGQGIDWAQDSFVKYNSPYSAQMSMININPSVAFHLTKSLLLGAGVDVYWSRLKFKQSFPWAMAFSNPALPDGVASFQGDGMAVGGNVGLTWLITRSQRLALTYRSRFDVSYDGDFDVSNMPQGSPLSPTSSFSSKMKFPDILGVGYGVELAPNWNVEADAEWITWSRNDSQPIDIGSNNLLLPPSARIVNNDWSDTFTAGLSTEYRFATEWAVRAGYTFVQSPIPNRTFSPILGDTDTHVITFGLGWHSGRHAVNAAYALNLYEDRNITDNQSTALNGDYSVSSDLISLSYVLTFL
ncbi:MAG: outer membrane protein transport protein [bacterium]